MHSVNRDFLIYVFCVKYKQRKLFRDLTAVFLALSFLANGFGKVPTIQIILRNRGNSATEAKRHS